jgi:2-C-methyl-D-erythritol 4-phosphate cytidylyltransferase
MTRTGVVVPAAGGGSRMGGRRKPFLELAGEPVLARALRPFLGHPTVEIIVVALPPDVVAEPPHWLSALDPRIQLVVGGRERGDSVRAALDRLPPELDVIVVHDAARPLVSADIVVRAIEAAAGGVGAVVAVPVTDTIKEVDATGCIVATPDRSRLWAAQTPQAFPASMLRAAYARSVRDGVAATDDAALVTHYGGKVVVLPGEARNLKITAEIDLQLASILLRS